MCCDFFTLCSFSAFMEDRKMSWHWKSCFAPGYILPNNLLLSIHCIHNAYLWQCTNRIPPTTTKNTNRHTNTDACWSVAVNSVGSMHLENKTQWISLRLRQSMCSTHKHIHTHTKNKHTLQQKYCDYPINADIRRRCCQCKAQLLTL